METSEIRSMKGAELHAELERMRRHVFDLHSQAVTEKLENPHQIKEARKDIARILTVLNERGEQGIEETQRHLESVAARSRGV